MSYSEIHFHLLPGVDDGPPSLEQSLELAQLAVADGTRTIVATPHVHPLHIIDPSEIADRVQELTPAYARRGSRSRCCRAVNSRSTWSGGCARPSSS